MLSELYVSQFAIIDDLHLTFHAGFNVFTGETGAGKSIIIDAIELLLGGKSHQEMVRAGEVLARVEGIFQLQDAHAAIGDWLQAHQLEAEEGQLILAREVRRRGRSVARINGRAVAQSLLAELGRFLVDIHGQGQHLSLLNTRTHGRLLDQFANLQAQQQEIAQRVQSLRTVRAELAHLRQNARELARRLDLLRYQVQEIDDAGLAADEQETLENERRRLANTETLMRETAALEALLAEGDGSSPAALDVLGAGMVHLEKLARLDSNLAPLLNQATALFDGVSDLARSVSDYAAILEHDPQRLNEIEERLTLIGQLQRKYGDTITEVLAFGENARSELTLLADSETRTEDLEAQEGALLRDIGQRANALSQARAHASQALAQAIKTELDVLRMAGTRFEVSISQKLDESGCYVGDTRFAFDATGIDKIEFMVSTNPGEPMRPLARVASGGETARMMLALKNVLSQADATPTLIFDEIDQGIGGRVGAIVGQKLRNLAAEHQVLCVTHLPQIAAFADQHMLVSKHVIENRTRSDITVLTGQAQIQELAIMLGADSDSGRQSAAELLTSAQLKSGGRM